jgi:dTDP-glucose 4,6-dehydratase
VDYLKHPIGTLEVGSIGTQNMLNIAEDKACRFLLASTSEVYGDPKVNPQSENYWGNVNPVGPRSVYDEAKRYAEALTMAYNRTHGVGVRIARIFNTYGPRMRIRDGRAVSNFIVQALRGEPLTVYGDGTQTRSFCYVDDEVDGIFRLFQSELTGPINIGNPSEVHVVALAKLIIELTGSKSILQFVELPEDDPKVRNPDISLAENLLGWTPRTSLEEGLAKTIEFFKDALRDSRFNS